MLVLSLFLLVGCNKKLVCTYNDEANKYTEDRKIVITFKDEKPIDMETTLTFKSDDAETMETFKENIKESQKELEEDIDSEIKETDNSVSFIFSKKLSANEKVISGKNDYESIKKHFEENSYTCK